MNLILIHLEVITEAAIDALRKHETDHYTPALGIDELRQAICDFHKRKDGIDLQKEQVATFQELNLRCIQSL